MTPPARGGVCGGGGGARDEKYSAVVLSVNK